MTSLSNYQRVSITLWRVLIEANLWNCVNMWLQLLPICYPWSFEEWVIKQNKKNKIKLNNKKNKKWHWGPSTSGLSVELLLRVIDVKYGCFTLLYFTVESNYVIGIATRSDWLKRLAPVFQPMRGKTKTNCTMYTWFFPRFKRITSTC